MQNPSISIHTASGGRANLPAETGRPAVQEVWLELRKLDAAKKEAAQAFDVAKRATTTAKTLDEKENLRAVRKSERRSNQREHEETALVAQEDALSHLQATQAAVSEVYGELVGVIRTDRPAWREELLERERAILDALVSASAALEMVAADWRATDSLLVMLEGGEIPRAHQPTPTPIWTAMEKVTETFGIISSRIKALSAPADQAE